MQYNTCQVPSHLAATRREWHHREVVNPFDSISFGSSAPSACPRHATPAPLSANRGHATCTMSCIIPASNAPSRNRRTRRVLNKTVQADILVLCHDSTAFSGRKRSPTSAGSVTSSSSRTINTREFFTKCLPQTEKKEARFTRCIRIESRCRLYGQIC